MRPFPLLLKKGSSATDGRPSARVRLFQAAVSRVQLACAVPRCVSSLQHLPSQNRCPGFRTAGVTEGHGSCKWCALKEPLRPDRRSTLSDQARIARRRSPRHLGEPTGGGELTRSKSDHPCAQSGEEGRKGRT